MKVYSYIQYNTNVKYPDGIYNALYNKEPAIIRIKDGVPVFVQFIENNSIYAAKGILLSSVELLIPAQELKF